MRTWEDELAANSMSILAYSVVGAIALGVLASGALAGTIIRAVRENRSQGPPLFQRRAPEDPWSEPADATGLGSFGTGSLVLGEETTWQ